MLTFRYVIRLVGGNGYIYFIIKGTSYLIRIEKYDGTVEEARMKFIGKLGVNIELIKGFLLDFFIDYSYCRMTLAEITINIGGLEGGIGIGFKF